MGEWTMIEVGAVSVAPQPETINGISPRSAIAIASSAAHMSWGSEAPA